MLPAHMGAPWEVYAGDDTSLELTFRDGETPLDLSEWSQWRAQYRIADYANDAVELIVDAQRSDQGVITVSIPAQMSAIGVGRITQSGVWDLQAVSSSQTRTFPPHTTHPHAHPGSGRFPGPPVPKEDAS